MMRVNFCLVALVATQAVSGFTFQHASPVKSSALHMTTEEAPTKNINVGVIGCGRIGLVHLEAITKAPGVTPIIVSNPTVSKAEAGKKIRKQSVLLLLVSLLTNFTGCYRLLSNPNLPRQTTIY